MSEVINSLVNVGCFIGIVAILTYFFWPRKAQFLIKTGTTWECGFCGEKGSVACSASMDEICSAAKAAHRQVSPDCEIR